MLYSIIIIIIIIALLEVLFKIVFKKDSGNIFFIIKIIAIFYTVCDEVKYIYVLKNGDFSYFLNWDFFLNDWKNNEYKYVFPLIILSLLLFVVSLIYRGYVSILGYLCNRFNNLFDIATIKHGLGQAIVRMSYDGILNIENGKVVKDKRTSVIKGSFKEIRNNHLLGEQALTASLFSILLIYCHFGIIWVVLFFALIIHILLSLYINSFVRSLRHIDKLL